MNHLSTSFQSRPKLLPEHSCFEGLKWRLVVDWPTDFFMILSKALVKAGFKNSLEALFPSVLGLADEGETRSFSFRKRVESSYESITRPQKNYENGPP